MPRGLSKVGLSKDSMPPHVLTTMFYNVGIGIDVK